MKENHSFRVILSTIQKLREYIVIRPALPEILRKFFRQKNLQKVLQLLGSVHISECAVNGINEGKYKIHVFVK